MIKHFTLFCLVKVYVQTLQEINVPKIADWIVNNAKNKIKKIKKYLINNKLSFYNFDLFIISVCADMSKS